MIARLEPDGTWVVQTGTRRVRIGDNGVEGDLEAFSVITEKLFTVVSDGRHSISIGDPGPGMSVDVVVSREKPRACYRAWITPGAGIAPGEVLAIPSLTVHRLGVNLHKIHVETRWFEEMLRGVKRIEGRLYDEKRRAFRVGDLLEVIRSDEALSFYAVIRGMRLYKSFEEMLAVEGLENVLPGVYSIEEGVGVYRRFYGESDEKRWGVVALEVEVL